MFSIPLRTLTRFRTPKYSFSLFEKIFKQKQSESQSQKPNQQNFKTNPNQKQQSKPQTKTPSAKEQVEDYDLFSRQKQNLRNIDYTKLKQMSKEIPQNIGRAGVQQVMFWADGVENPEEIFKLIDSFNEQWKSEDASELVQNYKFQEFCQKVIKYSYLAKDFETISKIAEFGVLYDIRQEQLWKKLEQKLLSLLKNNLDLEVLCQILLKFVKMRQGDMIYYKIEDLAQANLNKLTPSSTSKILYSMFERETGDIKTLKVYLNHFLNMLDVATPQDIVLFSTFLPYIKLQSKQQILDKIQSKILKDDILKKIDVIEMSVITRSFGNQYGSDQFWRTVESRILEKQDLSINQCQQIIYGPLNSYQLKPQKAKIITDKILPQAESLKATHLSQLSKVLYIYELDNQSIYQKLQGLIMEQLQDLQLTSLQELMNICKNYSVTRHGSRDIYKLLQVVIMARIGQIKLNRKVFIALYNIYNKSDLCSAQLLKEFAKYR